MVKRTSPQAKTDDLAFPIRVKILVPELGFGRKMDDIVEWLRNNLAATDYAWHGAQSYAHWHTTAFYFRSITVAARFLEEHPWLEVADETVMPTYTSPAKAAAVGRK